MTCRHRKNDPSCGGYEGRVQSARQLVDEYDSRQGTTTPDSRAYEVLKVQEIGTHLFLKVKYPNCANCAFEGIKCLVFLDTQASTALLWKEIDPHFRDKEKASVTKRAPSPAARFPPTKEGWEDALAYAKGKVVENVIES